MVLTQSIKQYAIAPIPHHLMTWLLREYREPNDKIQKIDAVNMERVKDDIRRFISKQDQLAIWSPRYFHNLSEKLIIEQE